jgi:hypothetical protein
MTAPPVWLLDIDGVINANRPGWGGPPRRVTCAGFTIRWAPALVQRIKDVRAAGLADIRWSSTWCAAPADLGELAGRLGLFLDSALTGPAPGRTWAAAKADAAVAVLDAGRRLIWTDDEEVGTALDHRPELAAAAGDGRALLIAPRANRGLQPADLDAIEAFGQARAAS